MSVPIFSRSYFIKTPWWLKRIYSSYTWSIKTNEKIIYLSFDDGPHEKATPFVLETLQAFDAKATFFCIGRNVKALPELYQRIIEEGHSVGNHTQNHLNGWKTRNDEYVADAAEAAKYINSNLFRPPYGRIRSAQAKDLQKAIPSTELKIIMWSVLSADFDLRLTGEECLQNVVRHTQSGSIVVYHDSEKAFTRLAYSLPLFLKYFSERGFRFEAIKPMAIAAR